MQLRLAPLVQIEVGGNDGFATDWTLLDESSLPDADPSEQDGRVAESAFVEDHRPALIRPSLLLTSLIQDSPWQGYEDDRLLPKAGPDGRPLTELRDRLMYVGWVQSKTLIDAAQRARSMGKRRALVFVDRKFLPCAPLLFDPLTVPGNETDLAAKYFVDDRHRVYTRLSGEDRPPGFVARAEFRTHSSQGG